MEKFLNKNVKVITTEGEILKGKLKRMWVNYNSTLSDCYIYFINKQRVMASSILSIEEIK